jgi:hypothetical protein
MGRVPELPGPGSYRLLCWVARLGIAGIEPTRLVLGISQAVAYSHVARLVDAGLLWRAWVNDGGGGIVAVTRAGAREARERGALGVVMPRSAAPRSARHGRAVSWAAAAAELRGVEWLGPAQLRTRGWRVRRDDGAAHAPDLGLLRGSGRTAVEVELHPKAPARLAVILAGYRALIDGGELTGVSYLVDRRDVAALVRRQAERPLLGSGLRVGELARVIEDARIRGNARRAAGRALEAGR